MYGHDNDADADNKNIFILFMEKLINDDLNSFTHHFLMWRTFKKYIVNKT